jgi:hypothetical protein
MKLRLLPPVLALAICIFGFLGINLALPQKAASAASQPHYLIHPLQADRVFFVQPRLALGNLAPESLWTSLEEIGQRYYIKDSKLFIKQVNGRAIPGLVVFTEPLGELAESTDMIATGN